MSVQDTKVQWPGNAFAKTEDDLSKPIRTLLENLRLLEKPADEGNVKPVDGTPVSLQVITSGATTLAKGWSVLLAAFGGGGALISGLKGLGWTSSSDLQRAVFTASAAVLAAAVAVSIAMIVKSDVSARAAASAAEYAARSTVTNALLSSFQYSREPLPIPEPEPNYILHTKDDNWHAVRKFTWDAGKITAIVDDGTRLTADQIDWIVPSTSWKPKTMRGR